MKETDTLLSDVETRFKCHAQPEQAKQMRVYMKDQFPFLGIAQPKRKSLLKPTLIASKQLECEQLLTLITALYDLDEREFQYAAIDIFHENVKRFSADWYTIVPYLALVDRKAWWDSVDALRKPIASWTLQHKASHLSSMMKYLLGADSLWLRRLAITLQLQWKTQTDKAWLAQSIEMNRDDHQFFIQKAIGWALREFSKTEPDWVADFLQVHQTALSALAIKEASKYLHR